MEMSDTPSSARLQHRAAFNIRKRSRDILKKNRVYLETHPFASSNGVILRFLLSQNRCYMVGADRTPAREDGRR